jgi:hypothetical protein
MGGTGVCAAEEGGCVLEKRSFQGSHIASQITRLDSLDLPARRSVKTIGIS